jgi:hypothetical protein
VTIYARVQRLVSVVKTATVLEACITEEQRSVVRVLRIKELSAKDINRKMFPFYGGKCLSRKAVHNWVANVLLMTEEVETEVGKWLRQQSKTCMLRVSTDC